MKKVLYGSLLLLLMACGASTSDDKGNSVDEINQDEVNVSDSIKSETSNEVAEPVVAESDEIERNCESAELSTYLNDPDLSGTNIREKPNGKVILKLVKDEINIEYFITVTEAKDGWFKIKGPIGGMEEDLKLANNEGWIHGSVLAVDTRNYGLQKVELLDTPENGKVVYTIDEVVYQIKLKDMCGDWIQIEYKGNIGWVNRDWLCGNPLTNCS